MWSLRALALQRVSHSTLVVLHRRPKRPVRPFDRMNIQLHCSLIGPGAPTSDFHHAFVLFSGVVLIGLLRVLVAVRKHAVSFVHYLVGTQFLLDN